MSSFLLMVVLFFVFQSSSFAESTTANPESWGDLGYAHDTADSDASPEVEKITEVEPEPETKAEPELANPHSANPDSNDEAQETLETRPLEKQRRASPSKARVSNVSTVRNTHGVLTEENPPLQFYLSPFFGMTSFMGNSTVDTSPGYALGASVGLLLSSNMMAEVAYIFSENNLNSGILNYRQNEFDGGVKFFVLGRESKFRPYIGGGLGYVRSSINYNNNAAFLGNAPMTPAEYTNSHYLAYGLLGAEYAFNRKVVANATFKFGGSISGGSNAESASPIQDVYKSTASNSLSRTAAYTLGAGLGIYF